MSKQQLDGLISGFEVIRANWGSDVIFVADAHDEDWYRSFPTGSGHGWVSRFSGAVGPEWVQVALRGPGTE